MQPVGMTDQQINQLLYELTSNTDPGSQMIVDVAQPTSEPESELHELLRECYIDDNEKSTSTQSQTIDAGITEALEALFEGIKFSFLDETALQITMEKIPQEEQINSLNSFIPEFSKYKLVVKIPFIGFKVHSYFLRDLISIVSSLTCTNGMKVDAFFDQSCSLWEFQNLSVLNFSHCPLRDHDLKNIVAPELKHLVLQGCQKLTSEVFERLPIQFPQLEFFNARGCQILPYLTFINLSEDWRPLRAFECAVSEAKDSDFSRKTEGERLRWIVSLSRFDSLEATKLTLNLVANIQITKANFCQMLEIAGRYGISKLRALCFEWLHKEYRGILWVDWEENRFVLSIFDCITPALWQMPKQEIFLSFIASLALRAKLEVKFHVHASHASESEQWIIESLFCRISFSGHILHYIQSKSSATSDVDETDRLLKLIRFFPELKGLFLYHLQLSSKGLEDLAQATNHLEALSLIDCSGFTVADLASRAASWKELTALDVENKTKLLDIEKQFLFNHYPKIKENQGRSMQPVGASPIKYRYHDGETIQITASHVPSVIEPEVLQNCSQYEIELEIPIDALRVSSIFLEKLAPYIKTLIFQNKSTTVGLAARSKKYLFPKLTTLNFSQCPLGDSDLQGIEARALQHLVLEGCYKLSPAALQQLPVQFPRLVSLNARQCSWLTRFDVAKMRFSSLKRFEFDQVLMTNGDLTTQEEQAWLQALLHLDSPSAKKVIEPLIPNIVITFRTFRPYLAIALKHAMRQLRDSCFAWLKSNYGQALSVDWQQNRLILSILDYKTPALWSLPQQIAFSSFLKELAAEEDVDVALSLRDQIVSAEQKMTLGSMFRTIASSVKRLHISYVPSGTISYSSDFPALLSVIQLCPYLQELSLHHFMLKLANLKILAANTTGLTRLSLIHCCGFTVSDLAMQAVSWRTLTSLTLEKLHQEKLSDDERKDLVTAYPHLKINQ